ncbi:MAG TPA: hypothetical protein VGN86_11335 [Pyrinomonadaceae bacterium]|nr:hypothetical protein [Pyrinomonadaceae bacterium]
MSRDIPRCRKEQPETLFAEPPIALDAGPGPTEFHHVVGARPAIMMVPRRAHPAEWVVAEHKGRKHFVVSNKEKPLALATPPPPALRLGI